MMTLRDDAKALRKAAALLHEEREPVMVYDRCGNLNLVRLTDE
jgi:hypothetical protein